MNLEERAEQEEEEEEKEKHTNKHQTKNIQILPYCLAINRSFRHYHIHIIISKERDLQLS